MIVLAVGLPGYGKSQWLMDYVYQHARTLRFLVGDHVGEWDAEYTDPPPPEGTGKRRWRGPFTHWTAKLARVASILGPTRRAPDAPWFARAPTDPGEARRWAKSLPATGVFTYSHPWTGLELAEEARALGSCVLVDDEIDLTATAKGWQSNDNPVRDFVHRGRHLPNEEGEVGAVHVLGACRRFQSLHIDLPSMANLVIIFRVQGARTIDRLLAEDIITDEDVEEVLALPKYTYLEKVPGEPLRRKVLRPL